MGWMLNHADAYLFVPSAVLLLWSALFLFSYFQMNKADRALFVWGLSLLIISLQPIAHLLVGYSIAAAGIVFWFLQSLGAGPLLAGLAVEKINKAVLIKASRGWLTLTVIMLAMLFAALHFNSLAIWLAAVYLLQSIYMVTGTTVVIIKERRARNIPAYIALFLFAATTFYYACSLLITGTIGFSSSLDLLNALVLSNTLSSVVLLQAVEKEKTANQRLATLVENTSQGLAFLDNKGTLLQMNGRLLDIFGTDPSVITSGIPAASALNLDALVDACNSQSNSCEIFMDFDKLAEEGHTVSKKGTAKLAVSVRTIEDIDGQTGTFVQVDDITETKKTLNELAEKRYRIELMLKAAKAFEYSKVGRQLFSDYWFASLGYKFNSIDVLEFQELIHPQDRYKYTMEQAIGKPQLDRTFSAEARIKDSEGNYNWFYISSCTVSLNNELITLGMALNIDLNKRMESYVIQSDRLSAVGRLANSVAHDINNHLMTIKTSLGLLNVVTEEQQRKKYSEYMSEAVANSTGILKRLVNYSKGDDEVFSPVAMTSMLSQTKEILARSLGNGTKLIFVNNAPEDIVLGNYYELQNALLNIGLNARDVLTETGGEIRINVWTADKNPLKPNSGCRWFYISVRDNGSGMSAEVQEKIFDPFFTTKPQGQGYGLGLYTTYVNVERHGGTISVESVQGSGTEFVVALPLADESLN